MYPFQLLAGLLLPPFMPLYPLFPMCHLHLNKYSHTYYVPLAFIPSLNMITNASGNKVVLSHIKGYYYYTQQHSFIHTFVCRYIHWKERDNAWEMNGTAYQSDS